MLINKQFQKFLIAGIINTIFFYALYAFLIFLEFPYYIAIIGANSISIIFSFKNFGKNVFDSHNNKLIWRFLIGYFFLITFYILEVTLFKNIGMNDYTAGIVGLVPYALLSFFVNQKYVYDKGN